jgi:hypothetical protein
MAKKKKTDWIDIYTEWPASAEVVAEEETTPERTCTLRTVQNWASKNGVRSIGRGNRHQYLFFRDDVVNFRQRERPGRRWPEEEK